MSAWPEAIYVVSQMRKALISEEIVDQLVDRRTVIGDLITSGGKIVPRGYEDTNFSNESLWFITKE